MMSQFRRLRWYCHPWHRQQLLSMDRVWKQKVSESSSCQMRLLSDAFVKTCVPYIITASRHGQKERKKFPNFSEVMLRVNTKADLVNAKYQKNFQSHFRLLNWIRDGVKSAQHFAQAIQELLTKPYVTNYGYYGRAAKKKPLLCPTNINPVKKCPCT